MALGIYVWPKESLLMGVAISIAKEVAEAITKRDKIKIVPSGSYALNALGLSTQIQLKFVLFTGGSPREIKVGRLENSDSLTAGLRSRLTTTLFYSFRSFYTTNQSFRLIDSTRNDMIFISELGWSMAPNSPDIRSHKGK